MTAEIQKLATLVELAAVLSQQNEYEEILRVVAQKAAGLLNAETAVIMMINPQTSARKPGRIRGATDPPRFGRQPREPIENGAPAEDLRAHVAVQDAEDGNCQGKT
jgi:hypothetical protein